MKFRKPASAMLAAAMLLSSTAIVSYAEEDAEMKAALTVAKERIEIPETFTEFNHSVRTNYGNKTYTFSWSAPDGTGAINATVCGKVITSFTSNREDFAFDELDVIVAEDGASIAVESKPYTFAKLTKEELIQKAKAAIKKLNPTVAKKIAVDPDGVRISLYDNDAYLTINRVENGVKVAGQNGSVCLDKNTGEMTRFNLNWIPGAGFRDSKEAIKKSAAQKGFQAAFPIEMHYVAEYDWKTQEYTPHLVFHRTEFGQIDAFTGKKATFEESYGYYENGFDDDVADEAEMAGAENPATGAVTFTEQEIAKMELEDQLIKPEQKLAEMIESGIWSIPESAEVNSYRTYFDSRANAYMLSASLRAFSPIHESMDEIAVPYEEIAYEETYYGSVTFNAETGEILSFYGNDPSGERTLKTENKAKQLVEKYFKEIAGEKAEEFPIDGKNASVYYSNTKGNGIRTEASVIEDYSVSAHRYVNGIVCEPESASISLDASGRVSGYHMNYLGLNYPKPENILETDAVYKKYFDQIKYELLYRVAYNNKKKRVETALVYNADAELYIDAFSGALVNGNGGARTAQKPDHYTDLGDNDELRAAAEKLALYNITLMDEKGRLNANKAVTREDFANLVHSIGVYYYEPSENSQKTLTRKYAAKILAERYSDIAELPGLFSNSFSDVPADDKYVGYIAIAAAKGYMKGENGKFRPSAKMTRGEALMLVYDYLSR